MTCLVRRVEILMAAIVGLAVSGCVNGVDEPAGGEGEFVTAMPTCAGTWGGGIVFDESGGTGATLEIPDGAVSSCANLTSGPSFLAVDMLPAHYPFDVSTETVLSPDGGGWQITLAGTGTDLRPGNFVTLSLPFDSARLPYGSFADATNTFVRIYEPERDVASDIHGRIDPISGTVSVKLIGLPEKAVVSVVHRPGRMAVTADAPAQPIMRGSNLSDSGAPFVNRVQTGAPPWPGRDWCVIHDLDSRELRAAVKAADGLTDDPTPDMIKAAVRSRVATAARQAQAIYESTGFRAPWLYVSDDPEGPCGAELGSTPRYQIHLVDADGSHYTLVDPDEATGPGDRHYGRLYIKASRIAESAASRLGSVRASVAHEMLHAVQQGYEIFNKVTDGVTEGTATVAGLMVDSGGILVRTASEGEIFKLSNFLMVSGGAAAYSNQDFFAFWARRYAGASIAFMPSLFQSVYDTIDAAASQSATSADADAVRASPGHPAVHRAIDAVLKSSIPNFGLSEAYMDFLTQRAMLHGWESAFSRTGETQSGFAAELYPTDGTSSGRIREASVSMSQCSVGNGRVKIENLCPFASRAVRIRAADVGTDGLLRNAVLTISVSSGAADRVVAWTWHDGEIDDLSGQASFDGFGSAEGDEIVVVVGNASLAEKCDADVTVNVSVACDEPPPQGEDPMKCGSSGIPSCNDVPAVYYWRRACEEYTGSHWSQDWSSLVNMCQLTTNAEWCNSGCSRSNILGTCSMSFGENAEVVFYYYTTVDYAADGFDPASSCAQDGGTWQ